eukprot:3696749-Lingulodinium_polyedra.AAC.1
MLWNCCAEEKTVLSSIGGSLHFDAQGWACVAKEGMAQVWVSTLLTKRHLGSAAKVEVTAL